MYWTRAMLKNAAKMEMKQSFWLSSGVLAVLLLISMVAGGIIGFIVGLMVVPLLFTGFSVGGFVLWILFFVVAMLALSAFLTLPLQVGMVTYFIKAPYGERDFSHLFSAFQGHRYMKIVKTMFLTNLYIMLWSLLFIIPGIVKQYQYFMVPYIISENPDLTPRQAMEISKRMTEGEKFNIFVLGLSFIGWFMLLFVAYMIIAVPLLMLNVFGGQALSSLLMMAGEIPIMVYMHCTYAQLYFVMRQKYYNETQGGQAAGTAAGQPAAAMQQPSEPAQPQEPQLPREHKELPEDPWLIEDKDKEE